MGWGSIFFLVTRNRNVNYTYNKFLISHVWVLLAISRYNFKIMNGVGHGTGKGMPSLNIGAERPGTESAFVGEGYFLRMELWIDASSASESRKGSNQRFYRTYNLVSRKKENVNIWKSGSFLVMLISIFGGTWKFVKNRTSKLCVQSVQEIRPKIRRRHIRIRTSVSSTLACNLHLDISY